MINVMEHYCIRGDLLREEKLGLRVQEWGSNGTQWDVNMVCSKKSSCMVLFLKIIDAEGAKMFVQ
jgi:hypothetical protein